MTKFIYVLSYNAFGDNPSHSQVDVFVQSHRDVETWYFPFLGTYLFKSEKGLQELVGPFRQFFGSSPFVLTYAVPTLTGGQLPQTIWDWINAVNAPALPAGQ